MLPAKMPPVRLTAPAKSQGRPQLDRAQVLNVIHCMSKLGVGLDDPVQNQQDKRKLTIKRCVQSLVHACDCREANCLSLSCINMKKIIAHVKPCKRKRTGCEICKQFIALCVHHAKECNETKCPVLFCLNIRRKLRQQQLSKIKKQAEILKVQLATGQNHGMPFTVAQTNTENSYSLSQPSPVTQPPTPLYPTQTGLDMKDMQTQTVQQEQTIGLAMLQHVTAANVGYDKNPLVRPSILNSNLMSQQQMQAPMQNLLPQVPSGFPNLMMEIDEEN